ncbi:hypothetical protein BS50DRAFT_479784 [Corynespora cassiicola Philippines]|uniref:Uncharacterized protein n=1 Tax=Corynespora cassiicola Philippines TaxID=1448308 RepID=A0A2T2PBE8_CORCC|nr:hypothetical protein BS50DRAFT_479784 [Corynespora cassiicola Philippines]
MIKVASPRSWDPTQPFTLICTLLALLTPPVLYYIYRRIMDAQIQAKPFPFMELPPELREMVYDYLVEDPHYPPPAKCVPDSGSVNKWMVPLRWPAVATQGEKKGKNSNWLLLANKQINAEFTDLLCKKATFHLTVSPSNYIAPPVPSSEDASPSPAPQQKIWNLPAGALKKLRKCDIKLITTSSMLGTPDPRNMKPNEWALARQVREELKEVQNIGEMNLQVRAIGDPLWNPLWVWYHASQSLKTMGTECGDYEHTGPKLNRITFSLDIWSPGENILKRDPENKNQWAWWCLEGHNVDTDGGADMTVREFCAKLYADCRTCRPEMDSDNEDEE